MPVLDQIYMQLRPTRPEDNTYTDTDTSELADQKLQALCLTVQLENVNESSITILTLV